MADEAPPPYQDTQQEEAPPAYQGKQEENNLKDNSNATATQASGGENKQQQPPKPPNDPEGEFGEPLKRVMWIGGFLLLFCILAFWLPVYYMDRCINICEKTVEENAEIQGITDEAIIAAAIKQCEEDPDALFQVNGEYYDQDEVNQAAAGYSLETLGIAFAAVGVILAYFGVKQGNLLYRQIAAGLLGIGGLMAIIGSILIAAIPEDPEEYYLASLIIDFVIVAIPASVAILLAYDVFNPSLLNAERNRMLYCHSIIFIIFGLMGGILYAYIANWEADPCVLLCEHPFKDELGCIAAGYLLLAILSVIRILIFEGKIQIDNPASQVTAKLAISLLLIVGAFICAVGYWAWIDAAWDGVTGSDIEDQHKCYYIGLSIFILGIAIVNALDMGLVQHWKACQAAQGAANAASQTPATAAT